MENDPSGILMPRGRTGSGKSILKPSAAGRASSSSFSEVPILREVTLKIAVDEICQGLEFSQEAPFFAMSRVRLLSFSVLKALREIYGPRSKAACLQDLAHHAKLNNLARLVDPGKYPEMSELARNSLLGYLSTIPGFQADLGVRQRRDAVACHNEITRPLLCAVEDSQREGVGSDV